ncbi:hypothetical protein HNQ93_000907 [Hymenobacter luteus]|uniref:Uncharacterized protein n=2 Tax=Hymenobacter TaxID=89966 RepID=A0A7W9SY62_9BACT|nr:hypothetical protein [Hymenobacter latericoloratus]MBB6058077.1 hypothetical protein [Hymenobacter luteus]
MHSVAPAHTGKQRILQFDFTAMEGSILLLPSVSASNKDLARAETQRPRIAQWQCGAFGLFSDDQWT